MSRVESSRVESRRGNRPYSIAPSPRHPVTHPTNSPCPRWEFCLKQSKVDWADSVAAGTVISSPDAIILETGSDGDGLDGPDGTIELYYSTCIEFPSGARGPSLLATQEWVKDEAGAFRLSLHRTIPYSAGRGAGGLLRCDCRGCVALLATSDRKTWGGVFG